MIPSPKTANRVRAPPEKRLRKPSTPPFSAASVSRCTCSKSMPGTGTWAPKRYRMITNSVNRILFRRSGTRNIFKNFMPAPAARCPGLSVGQGVALGRRPAVAERGRNDLNATPCAGDGPLGGFGECVGLDPHGAGQLAPAQDLDQAVL